MNINRSAGIKLRNAVVHSRGAGVFRAADFCLPKGVFSEHFTQFSSAVHAITTPEGITDTGKKRLSISAKVCGCHSGQRVDDDTCQVSSYPHPGIAGIDMNVRYTAMSQVMHWRHYRSTSPASRQTDMVNCASPLPFRRACYLAKPR